MDAQTIVLDRFPDAEAVEQPPIFRHGDVAPVDSGYWQILTNSGAILLGKGKPEEAAWVDAARKLSDRGRRDRGRPVSERRFPPGHSRLKRMLYLLG
jgi:hypothetical protein